ncbi:hypothetical protein, partial [Hydrogenophaga sp.]|uniref:hypothetical protein n=1 Tax=Hydrogenophaga sp. TaxID=1904254 RepID=UPI003564F8B3
AANKGELIYRSARNDAYVQALKPLIQDLQPRKPGQQANPERDTMGWTQRLPQWLSKKTV